VTFDIGNFLGGFVQKAIKRLFLSFIIILEDFRDDGRMSDEEFQRIRKRILDSGNDVIRDIVGELQNFDFIFKEGYNKETNSKETNSKE